MKGAVRILVVIIFVVKSVATKSVGTNTKEISRILFGLPDVWNLDINNLGGRGQRRGTCSAADDAMIFVEGIYIEGKLLLWPNHVFKLSMEKINGKFKFHPIFLECEISAKLF
jgi:hypothetical protein